MKKLPKHFEAFTESYPEIARAYEQLGAACHLGGPIPKKERALIKLGISMGARMEGAVHAQVRKSLEARATPEEIRHVALLALPTIGFPAFMAVLTWINDLLGQAPRRAARKSRKR